MSGNFFGMNQVTSEYDIKSGMTLYCVNTKLGHIDEYKIVGTPYINSRVQSVFCDYEYYSNETKRNYKWSFSLNDAGIYANCYNDHRTFYDRGSAEAFLENYKKNVIRKK